MSVITIKQKVAAIIAVFGEVQYSSDGKNVSTYCPVCEKSSKTKKKKKLSISLDNGVFHCWVCESKGRSIYSFYLKNGSKKSDAEKLKLVFGLPKNIKKDESEIEEKAYLPDDFRLLTNSDSRTARMIKKFLRSRGLDYEDLFTYRIGYSEKREFKDRVIFASFDKSLELNYFLSRTIRDDVYIKYRNCDVSKKSIIFNEDMIDWQKEIILVEGVFDAIKVGKNCVPMLGSWIDENYVLFRKLIQENSKVTVCLDLDARKKQMQIAKKMYEYGIEVKTVNLDSDSDIGDMSKKNANELITNAKRFDNTQRMRYLISGLKTGSVF